MSKSLLEQRNGIIEQIRSIAAARENSTDGQTNFTPDEQEQVRDLMAKAKELQTQITGAKVREALADEVKSFLDGASAEALNADALNGAQVGAGGRRIKSLGEYYTESKQFKAAMAPFGSRDIGAGARFSADPVAVAGGLKALIGTGDRTDPDNAQAGVLWDTQRLPTVQATWPQLTLRNVITVGQTNSDAVSYARVLRAGVGGTVNNAAGVPEATSAAAVGSGTPAVTPVQAGVKPESGIAFEKVTAPVVTIAHWVPATKKALSDAGQLRTLIDNFLRAGLEQEVERQVLLGNSSSGEEVDGLLNQDGIQVQAFDTNIVTTVRRALTKIRRYGRPNAILVSPGTAERIDLLRLPGANSYLGGGPFGAANPTLWRQPLVEVPGLDDDTVLLGDFSTAVLWDRQDATITATDSHADFFVRNLVAILAEARAAFGLLDPALIARVDVSGDDDFSAPAAA